MAEYYYPIQVRYADTDAQGHVFFGNYLTFFDEGVSGYMRGVGCGYKELRALGVDLVYAHAECDYHNRAVFEETLHVFVRVERIGHSSVTFACRVIRATDGRDVASGKLVVVAMDVALQNKVRVPDEFRAAVETFQGGNGA